MGELIRPDGPPDVRASDSDREAVVEELRRHHAEGRLALDELEERVSGAYGAKTVGELRLVVRDLPAPPPPPPTLGARLRPLAWYGLGVAGVAGAVAGLALGGFSGHEFTVFPGFIWVFFFFGPWRRRRWASRRGYGPPSGGGTQS